MIVHTTPATRHGGGPMQRLSRFVKHVLAVLARPELPEAAFDTTPHDALRMCTACVPSRSRSGGVGQGVWQRWAAGPGFALKVATGQLGVTKALCPASSGSPRRAKSGNRMG